MYSYAETLSSVYECRWRDAINSSATLPRRTVHLTILRFLPCLSILCQSSLRCLLSSLFRLSIRSIAPSSPYFPSLVESQACDRKARSLVLVDIANGNNFVQFFIALPITLTITWLTASNDLGNCKTNTNHHYNNMNND